MLVGRVEQLAHVLEDKFKWREWKYLFKLGTSKVVSIYNLEYASRNPYKINLWMVISLS